MSDSLQHVIIGVIVFLALLSVIKRLLPTWSRRRQQKLAQWLDRPGRSEILRRAGRFLAPTAAAAGCGSGCNTCSSCDSSSTSSEQPRDDIKPLQFHRQP